ncbi:HTH_Tnp_Tc3_2 domain-containing protein [Trichonephila clavipes]|uniref:HTH_Tnp_Tc3_2 domain-containing protein n=1 Tax=Trichonephila clavipes TaxID=2585209 RepID=A0A8X6RDR4_TRICX|nr:HTH_Tnp_Tc3_2 domain-containing protein [Trichonephila clavipes]
MGGVDRMDQHLTNYPITKKGDRFIKRHGAINERKEQPGILTNTLRLTERYFLEVIAPIDKKLKPTRQCLRPDHRDESCRLVDAPCWEQWTREGTHARKTGSGVTRKTTRREDRRIVRQALVDPTVTRSTIRADLGVAIGPQTISRHLAEANLKSKRPFRALPLTSEHRKLRLQWRQARSMWNVTDWQQVVFSDESRFVLGTGVDRVRVWRRPEHVWDQLKRQMSSCHSAHDLELAVQDLWAHLPQDNIRCLINSMPDRVVACIAAGGGPTCYWSCPIFVSLHILYSFNCLVFEIK